MRIAYMLTSLGIGGAERQVIALAERMKTRGHEVAIVVLRSRAEREWQTQLPIIRLDMTRSPLGVAGGIVRGRRFLRGFQPDILHSHTYPANMIARLFCAISAAPAVISTIHNVYEGGPHRRLAYRLTDGFCLHTTAVSQAVATRHIEAGAIHGKKCSIVTNGVDLEEFSIEGRRGRETRECTAAEKKFVWLAAGRAVAAKDYANLVAAFGRVRAQCRHTQLWIAGEVEEIRLTQIVGSRNRDAKGVRWLGHCDDMAGLLAKCDGFVLSSAWEGMPLVLGEAMAMERPVVATDVGGVRELVGNAGVLVPAKDPAELAEAMLRVMQMTQEERDAKGREARLRMCRLFDINTKVAEWERLYTRLLGDERPRSLM